MAPNRIIIDTDPGVDDVLAMLLAFSVGVGELEVLMLSLTHGNVDVQSCLRNVVTLFEKIEKERTYRRENGKPEGFETLMRRKPIVAVGAEEPLAEHMMVADFFHGIDGLGGIHHSHPHLSPTETWKSLFKPTPPKMSAEEAASLQKVKEQHSLFEPSLNFAPDEMLRILEEEDEGTVTIVAIGPLTNLAIAAAKDPETFLRCKEVVVMGGAVEVPGNMTPGAEFNTYADSIASARVFALTSPHPNTTMPPTPLHSNKDYLPEYPKKLSKQLTLKLFPLDITTPHLLPQTLSTTYISSLPDSPLATWTSLFLQSTYQKVFSLKPDQDPGKVGLELHDPLTIWYCLASSNSSNSDNGDVTSSSVDNGWKFVEEDIRVETAGQWTRGTCIVDRRGKAMKEGVGDVSQEVVGDAGGWLDTRRGNRIQRCVGTPGEETFAGVLLERIFGGG
ncbi:nucleoside hydrolase [Lojkania enalia]|uniref:Nucleoside hydrolase n=1 Tax=Lojkania enalia TaxID=147567 RepID=A0A9P4KE38_9PLEO|nr:nucleoside hydrolase [Didymosphaeria enalia]